ncbi:MAG TPA: hypothetical protein VG324_00495, partial [Blastocatellia bacterium]|nr:hypothetical protein [Blastocatellia bacterium]
VFLLCAVEVIDGLRAIAASWKCGGGILRPLPFPTYRRAKNGEFDSAGNFFAEAEIFFSGRSGTGSSSDLVLAKARFTNPPGRYRSLYCTMLLRLHVCLHRGAGIDQMTPIL